jgi:ribosome-associated protein
MIEVDRSEFTFTFSRSSGAGGQNVNKVNTRATLIWDIKESSACSNFVKERFAKEYKRLISDDLVSISSQKYRSQAQNIEDCVTKLHEYLAKVEFAPKVRKKTKPKYSSVQKNKEKKKKDSRTKSLRREKF